MLHRMKTMRMKKTTYTHVSIRLKHVLLCTFARTMTYVPGDADSRLDSRSPHVHALMFT
jgi:hypothetical protein